MRTSLAALTCCLLVVALAGATAVSGAPSTADPGPDGPAVTTVDHVAPGTANPTDNASDQPDEEDHPRVESIEIEIDEDGHAQFVLAKSFPAETDAQQRAFERLADEFEAGDHGDLGFAAYRSQFDAVNEESNRSMELVDEGRHSVQEDDVGRLEYRFTWRNFATVENGSIRLGDAFSVDGEVWLDLYEDQRLAIRAPDGYGIATSPSGPEIEDDDLVWTGPASFSPGDLDVTFDESEESSSQFPTTLLLGIAIALVLVGILAIIWWVLGRRSRDDPVVEGSVGDAISDVLPADGAGVGADGNESSNPDDGTATPPDAGGEEAGAVTDAEPSAAPDAAAATETVDPELLSDEERVEQLLEANGGRMKQANIVSETGWSNAKVSQLLSQMAEDDRVDKLRIGRENLITFPDVDVTDNGDGEQ